LGDLVGRVRVTLKVPQLTHTLTNPFGSELSAIDVTTKTFHPRME